MAISWIARKQITYFLIFVIVVLVAGFFIWQSATKPTCFDGKQNQGEEGVDCGGPCKNPCLGEVKEPLVLWTKFFEISQGKYDTIALIENPNLFLGLSSVKYQFKLYNKDNVLIAFRDGETFINPGETFPIFETNIDTGRRVPSRAFIELEKNLNWERTGKEKPQLVVSKKQFSNLPPFPRLDATINNKSISSVDNIFAVAILYNKDKNAIAVSATKIDSIQGGASWDISFTWPQPFSEEPSSIEIFLRTSS